ncbi:unnamed protein product [Darwinula stevensoni]|uniref:Uncharacterized protein n=1 Tax=Darwinula stevensoni TaxID=69355 RepID=A0A7R8X4H7_9CRUS|nr:unnamed protein product [Darwinula stevensoni]CAG0879679.1 unnamed protein product [Darwinula stevensoni]
MSSVDGMRGDCGAKGDELVKPLRGRVSESSVPKRRVYGCCGSISIIDYKDVPLYLAGNPYITSGYRPKLSPLECIKSMFCWTNESINIWTHVFGVIWLLTVLLMDLSLLRELAPAPSDVIVAVLMMVSFMMCLALSVVFHVFNCVSEIVCYTTFKWDVVGVALATFTFYWTGIYLAFICYPFWRYFYWASAFTVFLVTVGLHHWDDFLTDKYRGWRMFLFVIWAIYGFVPLCHWYFLYGGFENEWVQAIVIRVIILYALVGMGFFFYLSRFPERLKPGWFNYVGSSHQLWHVFGVLSFYWWHCAGLQMFSYLRTYGCPADSPVDPLRHLANTTNSSLHPQ